MRRLLDFLINATLDGRGDQLKAYSVAVDGLGRPADFDAQIDSYPRVQVGRLRRMLAAFYAREGDACGFRLTIPAGRYRVEFEQVTATVPDADAGPRAAARRGPWRYWHIVAIAVSTLAAVFVAAVLGAGYLDGFTARPAPAQMSVPPVIRLDHVRADHSGSAADTDADAILLDGVRRSWLVKVRTDERAPGATRSLPADYELSGQVSAGLLTLRLTRSATGEILWTGQPVLPTDRAALHDALAPSIAELIQPYGIIATDQRALIRKPVRPGYACMLEFDQYRRERGDALYGEVRDCVARTLAIDPSDALALAARAYLALNSALSDLGAPMPGVAAKLVVLARRAVAADPYSSVAYLALARAARFSGNCAAAVRSGQRAVALNPYDPDLASQVGAQLMSCDDPGAEALLRRAIALDPSPPPTFFPSLVILALDRGDIPAARRAAEGMTPVPSASRPFFDLVMAMVAAAEGDKDHARAIWARLERNDPAMARDPEAALRQRTLPDHMRARCMGYLRSAGLVRDSPMQRTGQERRHDAGPGLRGA